jgi:hypothetical protein
MPRRQEAKKDVGSCEKRRGAAAESIGTVERTEGSETSQYLEEKKAKAIP